MTKLSAISILLLRGMQLALAGAETAACTQDACNDAATEESVMLQQNWVQHQAAKVTDVMNFAAAKTGSESDLQADFRFFKEQARKQMHMNFTNDDLVVVPAVWHRFGYDDERHVFDKVPKWAAGDAERKRKVFIYQRLWKDEPFFVPNLAYEGTVYLKFIIDHYHNLPSTMLFVQDDYSWRPEADCLKRDGKLKYHAMNPDAWVGHRDMGTWEVLGPRWPSIEQCWRDFGKAFNLGFQAKVEPKVSFYCCNYFAIGRDEILKRPLSQWQEGYRLATQETCHEGKWNVDEISAKVMAKADPQHLFDEAGMTKHTSGGALEHLAGMIYGFLPADGPKPERHEACEEYMPESQCPGSPCAGRAVR